MSSSPFVEAFDQLLELIESKPKLKAKIEREFQKASDDAERVALVAPLLRMVDFSPISTEPEKSEAKATHYRELGNAYFSRKDYTNALINYNMSISYAPHSVNSKTLSFAFANRSVTLKSVGNIKLSIDDCKRALKFGYPEELQYKIYLRMGQCYQVMNQYAESKSMILKCKEMLSKADDLKESNLSKIMSQVNEVLLSVDKSASKSVPLNLENTCSNLNLQEEPELVVRSKANNEMPAASECVHLAYNAKYGRHLIAASDIAPGDVLIVEKPYTAVLFPEMKYTHCNHCFKQFAALLPCPECSQALYCSTECLESAWTQYHKFECPILTSVMNFNPGAVTLLTVRVFAMMGIPKLSDFLDNPPPPRQKLNNRSFDFNNKNQLDSSEFLHIYYLETGDSGRPYLEKFGRSLVANYLLQILKLETLPNFDKLGCFLMKISQSLSLHCIEFHEVNAQKSNERFEKVKIAAGIYPTMNMLNHSCDPDVIQFYKNGTATVVASKPIAKGSQICSFYRTNFLKDPLIERQHFLDKQFFFNCTCVACTKNWPSILPSLISQKHLSGELKNVYDIYKSNEKNFKSIQLMSKQHLLIVIEILQILSKNGKRLTTEYCVCQNALKLYFWKQGNYYLH